MSKDLIQIPPELIALFSGKDVSDIIPFKKEIFLLNDFVAGTAFATELNKVLGDLEPGVLLSLRRHPENEVDENAIGIYYRDVRIGWVHRRYNVLLARLMDSGKMFTCKIVGKDTSNPDWSRIDVNIFMLD